MGQDAVAVLAWSVVLGLTAGGMATAVRRLAPVARRVSAGIKPWACDVCLSLWCTVLSWTLYTIIVWSWGVFLAIGPAYAVALGVLRKLNEPLRAPPPLPDLEDLG